MTESIETASELCPVIPGLCNTHSHLRGVGQEDQGLLPVLARIQERLFDVTLAMPNLKKPVWDADTSSRYTEQINGFAPNLGVIRCVYMTEATTPQVITEVFRAGVKAIKVFFVGTTTNSSFGINFREIKRHYPAFKRAEDHGMVICCHLEDPEVFPLRDREKGALGAFRQLVEDFPNLRFVFEHVSSKVATDMFRGYPNVWFGITPHHLWLTENDVEGIGDYLCMPVIKGWQDRLALRDFFASDHPRVMCGLDDAPHKIRNKRMQAPGKQPAFGIWCPDAALDIYSKVLAERNALHRLPDRFWNIAAGLYGLKAPHAGYRLVRKPFQIRVEEDPDLPQPFMAGETGTYQVERIIT